MKLIQSAYKGLSNNSNAKVIHGGNTCTYAHLCEKIEAYSKHIISNSDEHQCVAIALDKSIDTLAIVMACVLNKRVYLAIDSNSPAERMQFIVNNAQAAILFSAKKDGTIQYSLSNASYSYGKDCLAILYTSGSTGLPKGVMISYKAMECFIEWGTEHFQFNSNSTILSVAAFHFDVSTLDIFAGISMGSDLVLLDSKQVGNPKYVNQILKSHAITSVYATPTWFSTQLNFGGFEGIEAPKTVLFAGEVFPVKELNKLRVHWPTASYYNLYGPTETNVVTHYKLPDEIEQNRNAPYPIGEPCPYAKLIIEKDELLIGGTSLMLGYVQEAEFNDDYYASGDKAKLKDGLYYYQGRLDRMIKHKGFRIEPAEIELELVKMEGVNSAHVLAADNRLLAFYTGKKQSTIDLKLFCAKGLINYMIPDTFKYINEVPVNANGKVNREALLSMMD